jgi:hypothetical protein
MLLYKKYEKIPNLKLKKIQFTPVKRCTVCKKLQSFCEFNKHKNMKYGLAVECKSCRKIINANYKKNNRDKINKKNAEYRKENKIKASEFYQKNKLRIRDKINDRYYSDDIFRLKTNIRNRIYEIFRDKNLSKNNKTEEILGISFENFKVYIEQQFKDGMSWENRSKWHIDHKVPLSFAKTEEEIIKLNYYTNLQPLWSYENLSKNNQLLSEHAELYNTLLNR